MIEFLLKNWKFSTKKDFSLIKEFFHTHKKKIRRSFPQKIVLLEQGNFPPKRILLDQETFIQKRFFLDQESFP